MTIHGGAVGVPVDLGRTLLAWADDEFLVGHQLGQMIVGYMDLEEAVALGSISQDELVHAKQLYELAGVGEDELDVVVFERDEPDFLCSRFVEADVRDDFAGLVVKLALYEHADRLRLDAAVVASGVDVAAIINSIIEEEAYHYEHWWEWLTILSRTPVGRQRLQAALARLMPLAADLFDTPEGGLDVFGGAQETLGRWFSEVEAKLAALGLAAPGAPSKSGVSGRRGKHSTDLTESLSWLRRVRQVGRPEVVWG